MADLRKADVKRLLEFVGDAHAIDGQEAFTIELLDRFAETMQSEFATYFEFDAESPGAHPRMTVRNSRSTQYGNPAWPHRPPEVPSWSVRPLGAVSFWSDDFEREMRWRFEMAPWTSTWEVVDSAWALLPAGGSERGAVCFFRQGRDFADRDRNAMRAVGRPITALIGNARARRRLADLTAIADAGDEDLSRGYVLLSGRLKVEHASMAARRMLRCWFEGPVSRLPMLIEGWLCSDGRHKPLRLERNGMRLVVEAPTAGALLLTEEPAIQAALTAREREVLRWLAAGKSTSEIAAELWVTPATVSKHLHNIYRKLGVTSRTAALAVSRHEIEMLDAAKSAR